MASRYVVARHIHKKPAYLIDPSRNSRTDQILRATATDNLQQFKKLSNGMKIGGVKDPEGRGLLHIAAMNGSNKVCNSLIHNFKLPINQHDAEDSTPLLYASVKGHLSTVLSLIENGADPKALQRHNTTALHMASFAGRVEIMRLLISKGADVNALSQNGTPLQQSQAKLDVVKVLLDHGANPNVIFPYRPSPLLLCIMEGMLESTKLLIQAGADPNYVSVGSTPLVSAVILQQTKHLKYLLDVGADPNIPDDTGLKPVIVAAQTRNIPELMMLFPGTTPIPECSDWSIAGILKYAVSPQVTQQVRMRCTEKYLKAKSEGDSLSRREEYWLAMYNYTKALLLSPDDADAFSKRSLCYARAGYPYFAISDAAACEILRPEWPETYLRIGIALTLLKDFNQAEEIFSQGLKLDPDDKQLQLALGKLAEERDAAGPDPVIELDTNKYWSLRTDELTKLSYTFSREAESIMLEEDRENHNVTDQTASIPLPVAPTPESPAVEVLNNTNGRVLVPTNNLIQTPSSCSRSNAQIEADRIRKLWEERQKEQANDMEEEKAKKGVEANKSTKIKGKGKKEKQKTVKISSLEDIEECMEDDVLLKNYLIR